MGKKIDNEIIEKIPILYEELKSKKKVAEELGISTSSVNKYLVLSGVPVRKRKPVRIFTKEEIEEINRLYSECLNQTQVSKAMGISVQQVKNNLNETNLKLNEKEYDYRDALFFYVYKLFGHNSDEYPVSEWNLTQMSRFKKQGISYRTQLLSLMYFYEVERNSIEKAKGSIGIIPHIIDRAKLYYNNLVEKQDEFNRQIERQLEQDRIMIPIIPINHYNKSRKKKIIDPNTV